MSFRNVAVCAIFVLLMSHHAIPQETVPEIRVSADAVASAEPDHAEIELGVDTRAATAQAAATENASKVAGVLAAVRSVLGSEARIQTQRYSLQPQYRHARDGGEAVIDGYVASNVVRVSAIPIEATGEVIDAATDAGSNNVRSLQFKVEDEETLKLEALAEAARIARARADALAEPLGLTVVRVLSVSEGEPVTVRPYAATGLMQAEARRPTPVEPGDVEVHARVTLRVEVRPR